LKQVEGHLPRVNFEIEKRIWLMIAASSDDLALVLRGAVKLAKLGTREGRQTAADMLRGCRPTDIETLVPAIRANALELPQDGASLGYLIIEVADWLHSPSIALKTAASAFLQDFTVENLLEQVRHWPMEMCKAMANIVVIAEANCTQKLTAELQSPAPKRRLAALQVTQLLGCSRQVSDALMPLLDDPRLEVRVRTIDLLGALGHERLEQMIPELLEDASTDIQDAASRAVRRMLRHKQQSSAQ
jgi:HEAT repeat protein